MIVEIDTAGKMPAAVLVVQPVIGKAGDQLRLPGGYRIPRTIYIAGEHPRFRYVKIVLPLLAVEPHLVRIVQAVQVGMDGFELFGSAVPVIEDIDLPFLVIADIEHIRDEQSVVGAFADKARAIQFLVCHADPITGRKTETELDT